MRVSRRTIIMGAIGAASGVILGLGWRWAYPPLAAGGGVGLGYVLLEWASCGLCPHNRPPEAPPPDPKPAANPATVKTRMEPADPSDVDALVERMLAHGRYALLLRPQIAVTLSDEQLDRAVTALQEGMALVPDGEVVLGRIDEALDDGQLEEEEIAACEGRVIRVEHFFLDRYPVTNRQFYDFVAGGGYQQIAMWDERIWPAVLDFVDQTGQPGPRFWRDGCYPNGLEDHPVVGVSWYEAVAYARWVGKRLLTDAEWVKAGSWPVCLSPSTRVQRKYPWGDSMERSRVNLWGSGPGGTVPVHEFADGVSVGGVYQLIGNVWEWTRGDFEPVDPFHRDLVLEIPMKSVRGGAFDTYFDNQATCQFQSGETAIARKRNVGFRCAVGACDLMLARPTDDFAVPAELESASIEEVQV
ncbi:MAG TPA: formylglycine-generating enzyme family protein [Thermoguttaceae bacterium]|nr:formylglycine-generating enzyme family protein [Thermoguttaceae bacterium]